MQVPMSFGLGFLLYLVGCSSLDKDIIISPMFSVCLERQDQSIKFLLNQSKPVDWDDGEIISKHGNVHVYVGRHPDFPRKSIDSKTINSREFSLIGRVDSGSRSRMLYAKLINDESIYVMLDGEAEPIRIVTASGIHFKSCAPDS